MAQIFKNACIDGKVLDIKTENGKIIDIGSFEEEGYDLSCLSVYPGLVDIHTHGNMGHDTMDGKYLEKMSDYLAKNGVTAWYPTTMTMDMETISKVVNADLPVNCGAQICGFHMEGPYIAESRKGAQNAKYIKAPDIEEFRKLKNIGLVTIAPELEGSMEFIKKCDAVVCIGHTDADYEISCEAMDCGAKCLTHTFNAMPPLNHREPGPVGAAIEKNAYVQVICDGIHIHKSVVMMLYRTFGADRMVLISDSMRAAGLADGEYDLGGQAMTVKNSVARTPDGALAGSTATLLQCVKKAIEFGVPAKDAFKMASETPSRLMNINKGRIEIGCDADFIAFDGDYNLKLCVIGGEIYK